MPGSFWAVMTPAQWQAVGSMGTMVVAIVAAAFAFFQVREARRSREERSRPYVAAFLEMEGFMIDLVVKNFGETVARNVTLTPDRPMTRGGDKGNEQWSNLEVFKSLPVMVPGQEWRTVFDVGRDRDGKGLDEPYEVTMAYQDSRGRALPAERFSLDWTVNRSAIYMSKKGINELAQSVEKMAKRMDQWTEGFSGLRVISRSGDERDRQRCADESS
jgi:hypothetical protein